VSTSAGSEIVITSAITRRASISCMKRRSTAEPPERKSSTLIPVSVWNMLAIFWAVLTGVDVYQVTAASRFAAAMSTGSGVNGLGWAATGATSATSDPRTKHAMTNARFTRSSRQGMSFPCGRDANVCRCLPR
jgi:type IV secretory pathway VirB6-like protein